MYIVQSYPIDHRSDLIRKVQNPDDFSQPMYFGVIKVFDTL